MDLSRCLRPIDAARRLGVTAEHVRHLIRTGQLRAVETPLGKLIRPEDIDALRELRASRPVFRPGALTTAER